MPRGMMIRVRVDTKKLDNVITQFPGVTETVLDLATEHVVEEARRLVPVRTGHLKSTIVRVKRDSHFYVYALAHYALYVEYGTRKMAAQPYLRPAHESINWRAILRQAFRAIGLGA